ncbi:ABC-type transport system involved in resistance to organic solvents, permease component [Chthonomonas calidirosea]|uniref:MlaE family ABC transporter permease n=1 Tax=Chthonomonas calidirosea TaxID=454171 RepID=UPI0006DD3A43|nr:ABC transporter permease [Chthonomonas calidirosea]CEK20183.1 ABC-type transport system involved in resistance to organic solvents, permease component [Chthonomonas calidirosea]
MQRAITKEEGTPTKPSRILSLLQAGLAFVGDNATLAAESARALLGGGLALRDLVVQMASLGSDSIWIVVVIASATGAVFAYYVANISLSVGYTGFVGGSIAYAFLNELGPVLGSVAFAARVGAAIAAEIGTMVVTEQVDALRAMAVSPVRYLVLPRLLACITMLPLLIIFADGAGIYGGYLFAGLRGVPHVDYINSIYTYVKPFDLINGLIKSICFGAIVGLVACQQGLRTQGGATGVGRATTSSVVWCVLLIFVADVFLTPLLTGRVQLP